MEISARNQLAGRILKIRTGNVMAEIVIDIGGGKTLTSVITRGSAEALRLQEGDAVTAIIKATEILVGK